MKKTLALFLVAVMVLSMMTACKKADTQGDSSVSPTPTVGQTTPEPKDEVDYSEHEIFTIWEQADINDYYAEFDDNPTIQYLNRKFNVTMDFEHPPAGSEKDAMSLMIGTGEYTDMMSLNHLSVPISELYDDGVVVNIVDYLDYMPNLKALLDNNKGFARNMYDDQGRILQLKTRYTEAEQIWGGLVYRRDILKTMTDDNISFPSGNDEPITIEDWEYMLKLYKQYFEEAGVQEYAPFILPYTGMFAFGELVSGFGVSHTYYLDGNEVKYGPMEEGFYNYLSKMKEWYELGYIYKDFPSRTNDPVYFPNPSLTYGGVSGIWYGLQSSLGDAMSNPDYGMYFDVQPLKSPLDTEHGITEAAPFSRTSVDNLQAKGYAVTTACDNIPKLLSIIDYMYSEEASMLLYGVTKEQGADTDPIMAKGDLQDGTYWFDDNGQFTFNPLLTIVGGTVSYDPFMNTRFLFKREQKYWNENSSDMIKYSDEVWGAYPDAKLKNLPSALDLGDDGVEFTINSTKISDYIYTAIASFITGTKELNETTWNEFKDQLVLRGIEDNISYNQAAYERFLKR